MVAITAEIFERLTGKTPRHYQLDLVNHLIELAESGKRFLAFEAPPGSGKSIVAMALMNSFRDQRGAVSTFTKQLQGQYRKESGWPYIMGRANYVCPVTRATAETAPCLSGAVCSESCQFRRAREAARRARRCIVNHALLYTFLRFRDEIAARPLIVIDECQRCADAFASCFSMDLEHESRAVELMDRHGIRTRAGLAKSGLTGEDFALVSRYFSAREMAAEFPQHYDRLRLAEPQPSVLVFSRRSLVLFMSATVPPYIRALADAFVTAPSPFPVESRPFILAPLARMNRVNFIQYVPQIVHVAARLARRGPGIIHTHNTEAAELVAGQLRLAGVRAYVAVGQKRTEVIRKFLRDVGAAALIGPGLTEGIDAMNVRWQLIPKVLWPDITDESFLPPEQEAAIRVAQAYGRSPRMPGQRCITIMLDEAFYMVREHLPRYLTEAVVRVPYDSLDALLEKL